MGVSACLLGAEVRFDGQHKRDAFLTEDLAPFVEWVSVCPEVEADMGVPREPVRLVRRGNGPPSMVGQQSATDFTERMRATVARRVDALARQDLRGYVLKAKSPSCGLLRVNLYDAAAPDAAPKQLGVGLFAQALVERLPNLPVEEEGRLHDAGLRENFIERVFAYDRLRTLFDARFTLGALVAFHTAHKMQLLAHSTEGYRALGHLVGQAKALPRGELRTRYEADFMAVLKRLATPGRQANVLTHMFGHLRKQLPEADKRELLGVIEDHRTGLIPLVVPVTLLRHHVRRLGVAYLAGQTFLEPHPKELMLRNHA
jgi:uncharacterized protein YbgA (DUF1722 family)/uncharacterized protein YbbK (DUF523 family)